MIRPDDLPDFEHPPLNEVVLGVQFKPAKGYQQIFAADVWKLYQADFPVVEDHEPIQPAFETFGRPSGAQFRFDVVTGANHDRFWFLTAEKDELIQFQNDRLLHNWRKVEGGQNKYPRFEPIIEKFTKDLESLEKYFSGIEPQTLQITQYEVSYINIIPLDDSANCNQLDSYFSFLNFSGLCPDDFTIAYRRAISISGKAPDGRLICDAKNVVDKMGNSAIALTYTVRGMPSSPAINSAIEAICNGRNLIVWEFTRSTTDEAHKMWGRRK